MSARSLFSKCSCFLFLVALPALALAQIPNQDIVVMSSVGNMLTEPVRRTPPDQPLPNLEREILRRYGNHTIHFNLFLQRSECPPGEVHQSCYSMVLANYWVSYMNGPVEILENEFYTLGFDRTSNDSFTLSVYDSKGNLIFTISVDLGENEVCVTVEGVEPAETICLPIELHRFPLTDIIGTSVGCAGS